MIRRIGVPFPLEIATTPVWTDNRAGRKGSLRSNGGSRGFHPREPDLAYIARVGTDDGRRTGAAAAGGAPAGAGRGDRALRLRARRLGPAAQHDDLRVGRRLRHRGGRGAAGPAGEGDPQDGPRRAAPRDGTVPGRDALLRGGPGASAVGALDAGRHRAAHVPHLCRPIVDGRDGRLLAGPPQADRVHRRTVLAHPRDLRGLQGLLAHDDRQRRHLRDPRGDRDGSRDDHAAAAAGGSATGLGGGQLRNGGLPAGQAARGLRLHVDAGAPGAAGGIGAVRATGSGAAAAGSGAGVAGGAAGGADRGVRFAVAADERVGVAQAVIDGLRARGHEVVPHGALAEGERDDWAWASEAAARDVAEGRADQGVVCCWTGTGASIAANKVNGVRAALCDDAETARGARKWNDANVLALSLRRVSEPLLEEILDAWFEGEPSSEPDDVENIRHVDEIA